MIIKIKMEGFFATLFVGVGNKFKSLKMKKLIICLIFVIAFFSNYAQNVGIGTSNPTASLEVNGSFKITNGSQGNGKVLTSDSNGLATWKNAQDTGAYYQAVGICCATWMTKNLDVITYRNGDTIPQVSSNLSWQFLTTGAWCYINNNPDSGVVYGKLYNWYAVNDSRGQLLMGGIYHQLLNLQHFIVALVAMLAMLVVY